MVIMNGQYYHVNNMLTGVGEIVISIADYYPPRSVNHMLLIMLYL